MFKRSKVIGYGKLYPLFGLISKTALQVYCALKSILSKGFRATVQVCLGLKKQRCQQFLSAQYRTVNAIMGYNGKGRCWLAIVLKIPLPLVLTGRTVVTSINFLPGKLCIQAGDSSNKTHYREAAAKRIELLRAKCVISMFSTTTNFHKILRSANSPICIPFSESSLQ